MREPFKKGRGVQGRVQIGALLCGVVMLVSCNSGINPSANRSATTASGGTTTPYSATVTRTQYGIPHILANDFGSAGYGYGYSFAEDNLCVMQEDFITVRGERSQYMGPSGSYTIIVNAATANNVDSDFFWKFIATDAAIAPLKKKTPDDFKAVLGGFVAGYNRYIAELKAGDHPGRHVACAAQPWVKPIVGDDVYRRVFRLLIVASSSALIQPIASAAPPALALPSSGKRAIAPPDAAQILKTLQSDDNPLLDMAQMKNRFGSNSYALGKDATVSGQPMLLGNPHFPWSGSERFYLSHLTIPGKLDIMGASLFGLPAINIGFNDHFAWTHTVSTARRFTFYQLILNPADPTQYLYEGKFVPMTATPVTIQVLGTDGKLTAQTRMMYRSQYGPMLTLSVSGVPVLGWDNLHAYTLRDANAENDRAIEMYGRWNQAKSLDEFIAIHKSEMAVPAFTTTATGPNGKAYFGDYGVVPNVTDAQIQICAAHPMHDAIGLLLPGLPVLDGSRAACQWGTDADAPAPGIFGPAHLPGILRDDYVKNANDSYWLTNANAPLVGYNSIVGQENYDIGLRPRLAILQVQRRLAGTDGKPGNRFDLQAFEDVTLASAIYSGELARDTVMQTICAQGNVLSSAGPVSTAAACDALKKWDLAANLDSRGAHLWREFWRNLVNSLGGADRGHQSAQSLLDDAVLRRRSGEYAARTQCGVADGAAGVRRRDQYGGCIGLRLRCAAGFDATSLL